MKRNKKILKKVFSLQKFKFFLLLFFCINSCVHLSFKQNLKTSDLNFKIQVNYQQGTKKYPALSAYAYIKNNDLLRLDIEKVFYGFFAKVFLKNEQVTLVLLQDKKYHQSLFKDFIQNTSFASFQKEWIFSFMRNSIPDSWKCEKKSDSNKTKCEAEDYLITFGFENNHQIKVIEILLKKIKKKITK